MTAFVRGQHVQILTFENQTHHTAREINEFGLYGIVSCCGVNLVAVESKKTCHVWTFRTTDVVLTQEVMPEKPRRRPKGITLRGAHLIIGRRTNFRYSSDPEVKAAVRALIGFYKAHRYGGHPIPGPCDLLRRAFVYADAHLRQGKKIK
jgi:hypothetical protein